MQGELFLDLFEEQESCNDKIEKFKTRQCKAKDVFYIDEIDKKTAYEFVRKYHYLGDAKFFCVKAFGLFLNEINELVGVATYSQPQGIVALKSWFSLDNSNTNIFELSRLCMLPTLNKTNATSFLLGGSIKKLKEMNQLAKQDKKRKNQTFTSKDWICRGIITLACSERHNGAIYQICNFKYFGMSNPKTDFYTESGKLNPRGKTSDVYGVWLPRARKHRYAYILDDELICNYAEKTRPPLDTFSLDCCNGTKKVLDARFNRLYTCPKCCGKLELIQE